MAKPIIRGIAAFDAALGYGTDGTVTISYSGSASKNRLYIYDAETNRIIQNAGKDYTENPGLILSIPAGLLTNAKSYYAGVEVVDSKNNVSELSDYVFFDCYSTPLFEFSNVHSHDTIENSFLEATLSYSQAEDRDLLSYIFYLYEITYSGNNQEISTLIYTSHTYYDATLACLYRGLESGTYYDIRAIGTTVDNMIVDTGMVRIRVQYVRPKGDYYILKLTNNPNCGWIEYKTNVRIIQGKTWVKKDGVEIPDRILTPEERAQYYDEVELHISGDSTIDATDAALIYDNVWSVAGDFMVRVNVIDLIPSSTSPFIKMYNPNTGHYLKVYLIQYDESDYSFVRFKLVVEAGSKSYIRYSDEIRKTDSITCSVAVNRINNLYSMDVFNIV